MDLREIKQRVKNIDENKYDDEAAHGLEDALYQDFVTHIYKTGNDEQKKMAREILRTYKIDFSRWCA